MEYKPILTIAESEKSTIVLARMQGHSGPVVIKKLLDSSPEIYRQLQNIKNPHLPQIFEVEVSGKELLIAEEYLDGVTLEEYLQQGQDSDESKLQIALQLCEAVGFLHALEPPVIHRDIKPANIMITGNRMVKLIDFDASRQYKEMYTGSDTRLLGTMEYAPPEQFGFSQTDMRSDIFSIGVVFHEMELKSSRKLENEWEKIVKKCTNFDPKHRYQGVLELQKDINKLLQKKKTEVRKIVAWSMVVLIVGLLGFFAGSEGRNQEEEVGEKDVIVTETSAPSITSGLTPEPTLTLVPTATPEPTLTPTPTPGPTPTSTPEWHMTDEEKFQMMVADMEVPQRPSSSKYNFYKGEAQNQELIFWNETDGKEITFLGGMCYDFVKEEFIHIPKEMLSGGPTHYRVSDEFLMALEPGVYFFYIARETETGKRGYMGRSAAIHAADELVPQREDLLVEATKNFFSEYQRDVEFVVWCDVVSRISDLHIRNQNMENERVAQDCYEITCDGKVLIIKKEFLNENFEAGSIHFDAVFDDGRIQEIVVTMVQGMYER
ncbi:MAG: serine/threonine protein kinase [Lachnospiraceae bacterium]|nr:serine/threonine protein kinase [Lachnospiraceae bacterium]